MTTIAGHYEVAEKTENVTVYGAAYEIPDIAKELRLFSRGNNNRFGS